MWRKREMKRFEKDRDEAIRVKKKQPFIKKERDEEISVKKKKPSSRCREVSHKVIIEEKKPLLRKREG